MKALVSAANATRLADANTLALCHAWTIQLPDGALIRGTSLDADVPVSGVAAPFDGSDATLPDLNGVHKMQNVANPSSSRSAAELTGESFTLEGVLATDISEALLRSGRFRGGRLYHYWVDYENPSDGIIPIGTGDIGEIGHARAGYTLETRRLLARFSNDMGEPTSPSCLAQIGGPRCKVRLVAPTWTAAATARLREPMDEASVLSTDADMTPFANLTVVRPTAFMGREFKCTVGGATHATTEPVWPTVIGDPVVDNAATWEAIAPRRWESRILAVADQRTFTVESRRHTSSVDAAAAWITSTTHTHASAASASLGDEFYYDDDGPSAATRVSSGVSTTITLAEPYRGTGHSGMGPVSATLLTSIATLAIDAVDDWFGAGLCEFRTGIPRLRRIEVDSWVLSTVTIKLKFGIAQTIQIGDHLILYAGCRKRRVDCRDKFENIFNARAEFDVPTNLVVFKQQRPSS